ncbi:MAG: hydrogenase maturation protease [Candidatus Thermoplasmatota archaeon]
MSDEISSFLSSVRKLVVIGLGNELRSDDAVGLEVVRSLKKHEGAGLRVFEAHTAPDAFIAPVCRAAPTHVLILDAAELGAEPGAWRLLGEEEIAEGLFTTHTIPVTEVAGELRRRCACAVGIIGMQPCARGAGTALSDAARRAVREVSDAILDALRPYDREKGLHDPLPMNPSSPYKWD